MAIVLISCKDNRITGKVKVSVQDILVTKIHTEYKSCVPFQKIRCNVEKFNFDNVPTEIRNNVSWLVKVDKDEYVLKEKGEFVDIEIKKEWVGQNLIVMAYLKKPNIDVTLSLYVNPFPTCKLFAISENEPGMNGEMIAEDMLYGDETYDSILEIGYLFKFQLNQEEKLLWADMNYLMDLVPSTSGNKNLKALINHFKTNSGSEFSSEYMNIKLKESSSLHKFLHDNFGVIATLKKCLKQISGNIYNLEVQKGVINSFRVKFNTFGDILRGMALAVDDTSAYKIFLLDYELVSPNTFNCKLKVDIYDHFGLDKSDVSKKIFYYGAGFRAWYVLQHLKGYKPFIAKMSVIINLNNESF